MLRLKDFNTAWWGRIRTASRPLACHHQVNAFVGASGSGKTTMMDAIRLCLGDAKFEDRRPMDHYIHPDSNWAVVRAAFWNRDEEKRPFAAEGFKEDQVTVCVRLDRSRGDCEREYYIFDGDFTDLADLGQNSGLYRKRRVHYTDYLRLLERVGITRGFRRLMQMSPESVREVVKSSPQQLFQMVFDLKGTRQIQDNYDSARSRLRELKDRESETSHELETAHQKLRQYEEKRQLWEENNRRNSEVQTLEPLLSKRLWWEARRSFESEEHELATAISKQEQLQENLNRYCADKEAVSAADSEVKQRLAQLRESYRAIEKEKQDWSNQHAVITRELKRERELLNQLQSIVPEDVEALGQEISMAKSRVSDVEYALRQKEQQYREIAGRLARLETGETAFPPWVSSYLKALSDERIPYLLLADCISVKPEYEPWLDFIEAFLGRLRYRVIIDEKQSLPAKQLQARFRYGAWVSPPSEPRRQVRDPLLQGRYPSLRSALAVEHVDQVGGYLESLHDIYLVDSIEEGHRLQTSGYTTISRQGLLQERQGSLYLQLRDAPVCGKIARARYLTETRSETARMSTEIRSLRDQLAAERKVLSGLESRSVDQNRRLQIPETVRRCEKLEADSASAWEYYVQAESTWVDVGHIIESSHNEEVALAIRLTKLASDTEACRQDIADMEREIRGRRSHLDQIENQMRIAAADLFRRGIDESLLAAIEHEALSGLFSSPSGGEWNAATLQERLRELRAAIEHFLLEHKDIDESVIRIVEPQRHAVSGLEATLAKVSEERAEWENQLSEAQLALRNHVHEIVNQYIRDFVALSSLLGAESSGKFDQPGDKPEQWSLHLKIGFGGKRPEVYYAPGLSSGERAVVSIMLLLAALDSRRDDQRTTIMFLDEPTARVDDGRANELGELLQITGIQYFLTHQTSASLTSVEWIDHAFIVSKLESGQQFALDPIFQSRRRLQ